MGGRGCGRVCRGGGVGSGGVGRGVEDGDGGKAGGGEGGGGRTSVVWAWLLCVLGGLVGGVGGLLRLGGGG